MSFPELPSSKGTHLDRVIADLENPRSLVNIVPPDMKDAILALPTSYIEMSEDDLKKMFPDPSALIEQLRRMFWIEFDRAVEQRTMMNMSNIYPGICSREGFNKLLKKKENLLWLILPPVEYSHSVEHLLTSGLKRVHEMFTFPLKTREGNFDHKLGELILKATLALDMRVKGGYLQRSMQMTKIESTNTNMNSNSLSISVSKDAVTPEGLAAIDEQLKLIEEEIVQKTKTLNLESGSDRLKEMQDMAIPTTSKPVEDSSA